MKPATSNPSRSRRSSWMRTEKSARNFQSDASDLVSGETEIFTASGKLADAKFWSDETSVSLRRLFHAHRERQSRGRAKNQNRFSQGGIQRRRRHRRRLSQRQICLAHRLRAAFGGRLGRAGRGVSRLDARLQRANWSAARTPITSAGCTSRRRPWTCARATRPASSRSARPATRKRTSTGRQWEQRMEVMRDSMIYFRNRSEHLVLGGGQ